MPEKIAAAAAAAAFASQQIKDADDSAY